MESLMTTLLRLDASARIDNSISRMLADQYQYLWQKQNSDGNIIYRDLTINIIPHLSSETIEAFHSEGEISSMATKLSDQLIQELKDADQVLISSPLYNLSLPSTLKSYFDHVVRSGLTFKVQQDNYNGLLKNTSAVIVTTRGGLSSPAVTDDFQKDYLKQILSFMGITDIKIISTEGTALAEPERAQHISLAEQQISDIFNKKITFTWNGHFSTSDQQEINSLRNEQAQSIVNGDAQFYADLCTEDVTLMIPGQDIIYGRTQFLQTEQALFNSNSFCSFKKKPESIERHGDIAIELGRQEITMTNSTSNNGVFSSKQKYMHVFRLTQLGWRYASLMSNPSE
jgi:uncharacterized protein (TIGR02246 family)